MIQIAYYLMHRDAKQERRTWGQLLATPHFHRPQKSATWNWRKSA